MCFNQRSYRFILILAFWLFAHFLSQAQSLSADSLLAAMPSATSTDSISLLVALGEHYKETKPQVAKNYLETALVLAEKQDQMHAKGLSLKLLGIILYNEGQYAQALRNYEKAISIFQFKPDSSQMAATWQNISLVHNRLGNYTIALEYALKSLEVAQRKEDEYGMGYSYNQIGLVFQNLGQYETAIEYYWHSLFLRRKIRHNAGIAFTATNLGNYHLDKAEFDSASYYYDVALRIHSAEADSARMADLISNIGNLFYDQENFGMAEEYYRKSLEIRCHYPNQAAIFNSYNNLAYALIKQEKLKEAEKYILLALEIAEEIKINAILASGYRTSAYLKETQGEVQVALKHLRRYHYYQEKDKNERMQTKVAELEAAYQLEQKDAALREAKVAAELVRSRAELQFWVIGFLFIFGLMAIAFFLYHNKQKNKQLTLQAQKNRELLQLNASLDSFVYSVSHDLKAPINSSLGLITLMKTEKDIEPLRELIGLQERSLKKLDAFIYDLLQFSRNSRTEIVSAPVLLAPLVDEIFQQLSHNEKIRNIALVNQIPADFEVVTDANRINTILGNLISNAIRYGNSYQAQPFVKVTAAYLSNSFQLMVQDNGIGIAEEHQKKIFDMFYRVGNNTDSSGIGLFLVKETVNKMGGEIDLDSTPNEGTTFVITLPRYNQQPLS